MSSSLTYTLVVMMTEEAKVNLHIQCPGPLPERVLKTALQVVVYAVKIFNLVCQIRGGLIEHNQ